MSQRDPLVFDKVALMEALMSVGALFPQSSKVTLVVYQPEQPGGERDLVFTDGQIDEVIARLELLKKRPKEDPPDA
jgi:hypothetical protein